MCVVKSNPSQFQLLTITEGFARLVVSNNICDIFRKSFR